MYGKRGRIGLLVPTGNSVMEPEFARLAPGGVTAHANRVYLKDVSPASLREMEEHVVAAAEGLVSTRVDCLMFGCTSGSFVGGQGYDAKLIAMMEDATGLPASTTTSAVVRALELLGVKRVALATPYTDAVTALEVAFLEANGFSVTASQGGGIVEVADIQACDPDIAYRRAKSVDSDKADAVFISCTGFRSIENLARLEAELGKPVISSNQASFADCLRLMKLSDVAPGFGSLFERLFATMDAPASAASAAD